MGVGCIIATVWSPPKIRRMVMLLTTMSIIVTGAFYFSTFSMFDNSTELRTAMQTKIMIVFSMIAWGLFLANLVTRQLYEQERMTRK
jgi:biotin transporter BioY